MADLANLKEGVLSLKQVGASRLFRMKELFFQVAKLKEPKCKKYI